METEIFEESKYEIENLNIEENLKKDLYYFNEKIKDLFEKNGTINFDIIIDNMSKDSINILLEYTTNIIEKYKIYNEFVKYSDVLKNVDKLKNSVIVVDEFSIFETEVLDSWKGTEKINTFFMNVRFNNNLIILTCPNKIEEHLNEIESPLFSINTCIHLEGKENLKKLYNKLTNKYNDNNIKHRLSYNTFKKIIDFLDNNYYVKQFNIIDYLYDYSLKKLIINNSNIVNNKTFDEFIEKEENPKENKKEKKEINYLIGLDNVKKELDSLYNYLEFSKKININSNMYLNMFFLGNPGTGKTTIARMYAEKLYELGFIEYEDLKKLVLEYVNDGNVGIDIVDKDCKKLCITDNLNIPLYDVNGKTTYVIDKYLISQYQITIFKILDKLLNINNRYEKINNINYKDYEYLYIYDSSPKYKYIKNSDNDFYLLISRILTNNDIKIILHTSYKKISNIKEARYTFKFMSKILLFDEQNTFIYFERKEDDKISIIDYNKGKIESLDKLFQIIKNNRKQKDILVKITKDDIENNHYRIGFKLYQTGMEESVRNINEIVDENTRLIDRLSRINDEIEQEINKLINR